MKRAEIKKEEVFPLIDKLLETGYIELSHREFSNDYVNVSFWVNRCKADDGHEEVRHYIEVEGVRDIEAFLAWLRAEEALK